MLAARRIYTYELSNHAIDVFAHKNTSKCNFWTKFLPIFHPTKKITLYFVGRGEIAQTIGAKSNIENMFESPPRTDLHKFHSDDSFCMYRSCHPHTSFHGFYSCAVHGIAISRRRKKNTISFLRLLSPCLLTSGCVCTNCRNRIRALELHQRQQQQQREKKMVQFWF